MSRFRDDAPPWSFFIPVALAVMIGVLAADAIRHAIATVFDRGGAAQQAGEPARPPAPVQQPAAPPIDGTPAPASESETAAAVEPAAAAPQPPAAVPDLPPVADDAAAQQAAEGPASPPEPARGADGILQLPGPITARRDNEAAACVSGTVANRVPRGWEQALENDAPVRCEATSH